jgi:hypothetical protein
MVAVLVREDEGPNVREVPSGTEHVGDGIRTEIDLQIVVEKRPGAAADVGAATAARLLTGRAAAEGSGPGLGGSGAEYRKFHNAFHCSTGVKNKTQ